MSPRRWLLLAIGVVVVALLVGAGLVWRLGHGADVDWTVAVGSKARILDADQDRVVVANGSEVSVRGLADGVEAFGYDLADQAAYGGWLVGDDLLVQLQTAGTTAGDRYPDSTGIVLVGSDGSGGSGGSGGSDGSARWTLPAGTSALGLDRAAGVLMVRQGRGPYTLKGIGIEDGHTVWQQESRFAGFRASAPGLTELSSRTSVAVQTGDPEADRVSVELVRVADGARLVGPLAQGKYDEAEAAGDALVTVTSECAATLRTATAQRKVSWRQQPTHCNILQSGADGLLYVTSYVERGTGVAVLDPVAGTAVTLDASFDTLPLSEGCLELRPGRWFACVPEDGTGLTTWDARTGAEVSAAATSKIGRVWAGPDAIVSTRSAPWYAVPFGWGNDDEIDEGVIAELRTPKGDVDARLLDRGRGITSVRVLTGLRAVAVVGNDLVLLAG